MTTDNRLELIKILEEADVRKINFEKQLKAIKSGYFDNVEIVFTNYLVEDEIDDIDEKDVITSDNISCNKNTLEVYLEKEITKLNKFTNNIIEQISKS